MSQLQREPSSGEAWQEHFVDTERASRSTSVGSAVAKSLSYVTIPDFATVDECEALQSSALNLQQKMNGGNTAEDSSNTHVLGATEAAHYNCTRFSVEGLLCSQAKAVSATLLDRLLGFLEGNGTWKSYGKIDAMSDLANCVFQQNEGLRDMKVNWYAEPDNERKLHPEPKVNIYTNGGYFKRHEDGMHLTLLIVLNDSFSGGGTAFYNDDEKKEGEEDHAMNSNPSPDNVCKPPAGTAVIWGANLSHMALPVDTGTRSVYVGSFDLE